MKQLLTSKLLRQFLRDLNFYMNTQFKKVIKFKDNSESILREANSFLTVQALSASSSLKLL